MQINIQQFIEQHLTHISFGAILTSCLTVVGCLVKLTWSGSQAFTEVKEARADLAETKEDVRTTLEEVKDLREDLRLLRPALEDLTKAVNQLGLALAELKGLLQSRTSYRQ
jgi:hypothetical protein